MLHTRRWKWFFATVVAILLFFPGLPYFLQEYFLRTLADPEISFLRSKMERHLNSFVNDQKALSEVEFFHTSPRHKDVGPFLNPMIRWSINESTHVQSPRKNVPVELKRKLHDWRDQWPEHFREVDLSHLDLSWITRLGEYDHWDIYHFSPMARMISSEPSDARFVYRRPLPNFPDLAAYAKLRLMKGLAQRDILTALNEVRHLAHLTYTTESLFGAHIANVILGLEDHAYEYAVKRKQIRAADWQTIDAEMRIRALRVAKASVAYFNLFTPPETLERITAGNTINLATCIGIDEAMGKMMIARPYLGGQFPFERDYRKTFANLDRLLTAATGKGCRLGLLDSLWSRPRSFFDEANNASDGNGSRYIPYLRKALGTVAAISSIVAINWFQEYDHSDLSGLDPGAPAGVPELKAKQSNEDQKPNAP